MSLLPFAAHKIPKKPLIFIVLCVAVYTAWNIAYPSGSWRYKLTVEVETPEGVKTGSAVREVQVQEIPAPLPESKPTRYNIKGEAVVVDLGERGQVFALLPTYRSGSDGWRYIVFNAFPTNLQGGARINYYQSLTGQSKVLGSGESPVLVRFRDLKAPESVESLLNIGRCPGTRGFPVKFCLLEDRFAEAFGDGVKLKSITIEMTKEPVTIDIVARYLPWLPDYRNKMFDGQRYNMAGSKYPLANSLAMGAFKAGDY